jgi:hypothetical protein
MKIDRLVSVPGGDIVATRELLERPYKISLSDHHPYLTLEDYFSAAEDFISRDTHLGRLASLLSLHAGRAVTAEDITRIRIRSEKHGALYHVSSVEVFSESASFKLALSAALTREGEHRLNGEWDTLTALEESFHLPYLPQPYFRGKARGRGPEAFSMLAAQWFEGFSEWHLSVDRRSGEQGLIIWDGSPAHRWAEPREIVDIYRDTAAILTLYYDTRTSRQIYPWRHAAGDFVVRAGAGGAEVRLTTARGYVNFMERISGEAVHPSIDLVYFFLNLVTRMRIDRLDGTGPVAWAGIAALQGAVTGFFEALRLKEERGEYHLGDAGDLAGLLKSFDREELERAFDPLQRLYEGGDPEEAEVIRPNLGTHIRDLHHIMQALPPTGLARGSG